MTLFCLDSLPSLSCGLVVLGDVSVSEGALPQLPQLPHSPVQPHVRQSPVEGDHVAGHQVELVDLEELLHLLLVVLRDDHCFSHLARTLMGAGYHSCKT